MSNWLSEYSGEEQRQVDEVNRQGIAHPPTEQTKQPSLFSGAAASIPKGIAAGTAKVLDTAFIPIDAITDRLEHTFKDLSTDEFIEPYSEFKAKKKLERTSLLVDSVDYLKDQENTGTIGSIGFSLSDYLTRAMVGSAVGGLPGAAGVTGLSETNFVYQNLTHKGVDSETATKVAVTDGVVAGAATILPIKYGFKGTGGLIGDAALSIGGSTALMTAGQYLSGNILDSHDYDEQAKYYEITKEGVATNVILNAVLFGAARGYQHRQNTAVENTAGETTAPTSNVGTSDVPTTAPIEAAPVEVIPLDADTIAARQDLTEHTLVANELDYENISMPVRTTDPIQQNNHLINLDTARSQIESGQPVNVPRTVTGDPKPKVKNYDTMAIPENAKLIARKARQDNVDPSVALTISHLETAGKFNADAKNPVSTAHGLFQILDRTWRGQGGGNRNDVNEQIKQGLKHIKNANNYITSKIGRAPVAHEQYLGHLLGPGGAVAVLKANPNAKLIDIVRKYDAENANAIVNNNGMKGLTVGQAINKWEKKWNNLSAKYGSESQTAYGMNGSSYEFAYEVKSLDDLIASNDQAYGVNPRYPSELQPRDRTREASRQQIENMADDLKPELLGESYKLSDGAPIIGMDHVVESGNGRTLAIGRAYETGKADAYRQFVNDFASSRGLDVDGINNPVLVRTRLTDTDRVAFTKLANESDVAQFSTTERALVDVDRLPDAGLLKINNDGTLNIDQSMDYVRGFVDRLPQSERAAAITPDGKLSQDGKRRIESAIVQHAYGDSNLVKRLSENLDDDSKTVLNALLKSAPQLSQLNTLVKQGGRHDNTIASDVVQAAQKYSDLKANGVAVKDYLQQGQLLDDGLSAGARDFLNVFDTNSRSAKAIGDNIQSKVNEIEGRGDPRQGQLFGETAEEKAALDVIMNNPDQMITVSRTDPQGNIEEITMTLRERLDELEAEAKLAEQDVLAAQTAISCALQFGE